jgi:hypothetical protein
MEFVDLYTVPSDQIPVGVLKGARHLMVERIGTKYFQRHFQVDSTWGKRLWSKPSAPTSRPPYWQVDFKLVMPSKPWVQWVVSLDVDSAGALASSSGISGVCDCAHHPDACAYEVTKEAAVDAARQAGLTTGLRPWEVRFSWVSSASEPCYHWVISNTLRLDPDSCSRDGDSMVIDAGTGKVIAKRNWGQICDFTNKRTLPLKDLR